ncbi:MAG: acylphosphatase [Chthoniobacterales bacterium]|nr:acylphosphatase [Chthoniobacterales bacterium]
MTSRLLHYTGKVQGVGFRATVLGIARGYEVLGYVKNLPDGRVELFVSGVEKEIEEFLTALSESSLKGHIALVQEEAVDPATRLSLRGFQIL